MSWLDQLLGGGGGNFGFDPRGNYGPRTDTTFYGSGGNSGGGGGGGGAPSWLIPLLGAVASLGGSYLTARSQNKAAAAQNQRTSGLDKGLLDLINGLNGGNQQSGIYNDLLNQWKAPAQQSDFKLPQLPDIYSALGLATDPILQSMRSGPNDAALSSNLNDLLATGDPYDTSLISASLNPLRQRQTASAMADLHSGAAGLGQRFGSAQNRAAMQLQEQLQQDYAAQDQQYLFQGHEGAQARRLQAAGLLNDVNQTQLARDNSALNALLGQANVGLGQNRNQIDLASLGLDKEKLALATQAQKDSIGQALLNNDTQRVQQLLQAYGLMYGQPVASGPGYGGVAGDAGQLALMYWLMNQGKKPAA